MPLDTHRVMRTPRLDELRLPLALLTTATLCVVSACSSTDAEPSMGAAGATPSSGAGGTTTAGTSSVAGGGGAPGAAGSSSGAPPTGGASTDGGTATGGAGSGGLSGAGGAAGSGGIVSNGGSGGSAGMPALERTEVLRLTRLVADHYLQSFGTNYDNSWIRSTFYAGLMAAHRTTQDEKYLTAATMWGRQNQWRQPTDDSIDSNGQPRHADNQACFQTYAELYEGAPTAANDVMLSTASSVFDTMVASPKAGEWTWCDALFMAPPALARVAAVKSKPAYVSLLHNMWWTTAGTLYNKEVGLFWRDARAKSETPDTYWSRGNGWVIAGLARVLEYLPESDARRTEYEALLKQMANALRPLQNQTDGLWRSDLLNPNLHPNPESSGTAFFCYGIAWGINQGLLDRATFQPVALKAWDGLVKVALTAEGKLGYVQTVARAPGAANREDTRDYAGGAFLLAASEVIEL